MARSEISTEFNTFVGGILTEANPINYPPGYSLDEENFILERNGTRRRRPGMILDNTAADFQAAADSAFSSFTSNTYRDYYIWRDAIFATGRKDVLVLLYDLESTGVGILFYDLSIGYDISNQLLGSYTNSGEHLLAVSNYSAGLVITTRDDGADDNDITVTVITSDGVGSWEEVASLLKIRDFHGTSAGSVDSRPGSLSDDYAYNLANAGWLEADVNSWNTASSDYPSLSDSSVFSKDFGSAFNTTYMDNTFFGNSRAPIGKVTLTPWNPEVEWAFAVADVTGAPPGGFTQTFNPLGPESHQSVDDQLFFAGRVFYLCTAGRWLANGSTFLTYSQSSGDDKSFALCYQKNDPTSEAFNNLLDTDGGLLDISSVGEGISLKSSRSRVMIFGTKGVQELYSADDVFKPSQVAVREVSNNPIVYQRDEIDYDSGAKTYFRLTGNSALTVEDNFYYWADAGIIGLIFDPQNNQFVESNLTSSTIDTLYREIPTICKAYATSLYLPDDNTIVWAYSEDTSNPEKFSKLLCYDMVLKAWFKMDIASSDDAYVTGIFQVPLDADLTGRADKFKRLTFLVETTDEGFTTAYPTDSTFEDFSGSTYSAESQAFLQTGYLNANDSARQKQATYIVPSFLRTEDGFTDDGNGNLTPTNESSCVISAYWDYADDDVSGKINDSFEAYRYNRLYVPEDASDTFNYGQSVLTTKNRLTGRGRALSLRFETSEGKDCRLLGWNLGFGANGQV